VILSGQPLTGPSGLESWCDRDIDTLVDHYLEQMTAQRMAAARAALKQQMGG
jgi:hypothetical protein